ncbi:MAG: GNAT family N-acetyltransferase [Firmicutes bacterium]|nr:GNAT family N-acetyltransferase [Bacillota bacterium]
MEIKHLSHSSIDFQKWDESVLNAANSLVYAESWYLNIVSPHWEALVLGDYEYVMPLPVKHKFGFSFLFQPPLTQQLGIFSNQIIDEKIVELFIKNIPYRSYHLNLNEQNSFEKGILQPNLLLPLNNNYQTLFSNYSTNTKRNIKKAQQAQIYVTEDITPEQFLDFYFLAMNNEAKPDKNLTEKIVKTGFEKKKLKLYAAIQGKELTSVLCLLHSDKRLIYLLAASNEKGKKLSAMSLIVDKVIQDFAETNIYFDFEGSKVETIARFYQGFGAEATTFPQIRKSNIVLISFSFLSKLKKKQKKIIFAQSKNL